MILVKEITDDWQGVSRAPNHTYIMDDSMSKMYGYFKWHNPKDFQMCSKPIRFDKRYRKFVVIKRGLKFATEVTTNPTWIVKGSKGNEYVVEQTETGMACSCDGFRYYGKCKHIDGVLNERK